MGIKKLSFSNTCFTKDLNFFTTKKCFIKFCKLDKNDLWLSTTFLSSLINDIAPILFFIKNLDFLEKDKF